MIIKMRNGITVLLAITLAVGLIYSCKKQETSAPVIAITSPYSGQIVVIGQAINVNATINYNGSLQYVKLSLINSNYITVDAMASLPVTASPMNIKTTYTITNTNLLSGNYFLQITAFDGTNTANGYAEISLHVVPAYTKAVYVITGSNNVNTMVWKVDSSNAISSVMALAGDFSNAAVSSADQCLYTTGIYTGNFNCINLNTNAINFSVSSFNNGFPTYERVYSNNQKNFIAEYDNVIHGYDKYGNDNYTATTLSGTYPYNMFSDSQYLYAEQRDIAGSGVTLNVYYLANGVAFRNLTINQNIEIGRA